MKNLWLILTLIFGVGFLAQAQEEGFSNPTSEGNFLIGTNVNLIGSPFVGLFEVPNNLGVSFGSYKFKSDDYESDPASYTIFNFSPRIGYFAVDHLLVGVDLSVGFYEEEDVDGITSVEGGPFIRYYSSLDKLVVYGQGSASFGKMEEMNLTRLGLGVGGAIFVNDKVSLDLLMGFNHLIIKDEDWDSDARELIDTFGLSIGFSLFL